VPRRAEAGRDRSPPEDRQDQRQARGEHRQSAARDRPRHGRRPERQRQPVRAVVGSPDPLRVRVRRDHLQRLGTLPRRRGVVPRLTPRGAATKSTLCCGALSVIPSAFACRIASMNVISC
jgi:hypothetical protein